MFIHWAQIRAEDSGRRPVLGHSLDQPCRTHLVLCLWMSNHFTAHIYICNFYCPPGQVSLEKEILIAIRLLLYFVIKKDIYFVFFLSHTLQMQQMQKVKEQVEPKSTDANINRRHEKAPCLLLVSDFFIVAFEWMNLMKHSLQCYFFFFLSFIYFLL